MRSCCCCRSTCRDTWSEYSCSQSCGSWISLTASEVRITQIWMLEFHEAPAPVLERLAKRIEQIGDNHKTRIDRDRQSQNLSAGRTKSRNPSAPPLRSGRSIVLLLTWEPPNRIMNLLWPHGTSHGGSGWAPCLALHPSHVCIACFLLPLLLMQAIGCQCLPLTQL